MFRLAVFSALFFILGFSSAEDAAAMRLTKTGKPCHNVEYWSDGINIDSELWETLAEFVARQEKKLDGQTDKEVIYDCFFDEDTEEYELISHKVSDIFNDPVNAVFTFRKRKFATDSCANVEYTINSYKIREGKSFSLATRTRICQQSPLPVLFVFITVFVLNTIIVVACYVFQDFDSETDNQVEQKRIADSITLKNISDV